MGIGILLGGFWAPHQPAGGRELSRCIRARIKALASEKGMAVAKPRCFKSLLVFRV